MKYVSLAIAAATFSAASAFAADLPSRKEAPVYVPPPPAFSWTGFYGGVNIGGSWLDRYNYDAWGPAWTGFGWINATQIAATNFSNAGVSGGVQAGYNYQLWSWLVAGVEADFQGTSIGASGVNNGWGLGFAGLPVLWGGASRGVDYFGTVRGRLGVTLPGWQQFLVYGTGGFAYGEIRINNGWLGNLRAVGTGWTVGGGVEWAFMPNWSTKVEYLYTSIGADQWGGTNLASQRVNMHTVRAGVNYHLNWGMAAPVLASY
ncbi:outer membrane beta-barrel protein [Methylocystis sp. WRRC1]|uniref:outer membrane protein n=1 Tax=unclassified Methylocystis TaxID=2625913 RepID=UPI0001F8718B|nr:MULTISPECIES: outer membrane beta-barrel protein [unclassified Methylocystis]MCC3244260.1 outer membrane beta-barrel protein [Methylocystis sp. WRRC1]